MKRILMLFMLVSGSAFWGSKAKASAATGDDLTRITGRACMKCIPYQLGPKVMNMFYPEDAKEVESQEVANTLIDQHIAEGRINNYFGFTIPLADPLLQTIVIGVKAVSDKTEEVQKVVANVEAIVSKYFELKDSGISKEEFEKEMYQLATKTNPKFLDILQKQKAAKVKSEAEAKAAAETGATASVSATQEATGGKHLPSSNIGSTSDDQKDDNLSTGNIDNPPAKVESASSPIPSSVSDASEEHKKILPTTGSSAAANAAANAALDTSRGALDNRVGSLMNNNSSEFSSKDEGGIAAGDETPVEYGLWVKGVTGRAKQKEHKTNPQYKLTQNGGIIGFDFGKENYVFGVAYTYMQGKVKGQSFGTAEKILTNIGSIYGMLKFDNNIFVSGQAQYGRNRLKKNRNIGDTAIVRGRTKGVITGARLEAGYDYYNKMMSTHFIPSVGVSYDDVIVKGYDETGNNVVKKNDKTNAEKNSLLAGFSIKRDFRLNEITVIPEVHVDFDYAMLNKHTRVETSGSATTIVPVAKLSPVSYQIGGSLKLLKGKMINLGIGYDLGLSKKFRSHTGYASARVRF